MTWSGDSGIMRFFKYANKARVHSISTSPTESDMESENNDLQWYDAPESPQPIEFQCKIGLFHKNRQDFNPREIVSHSTPVHSPVFMKFDTMGSTIRFHAPTHLTSFADIYEAGHGQKIPSPIGTGRPSDKSSLTRFQFHTKHEDGLFDELGHDRSSWIHDIRSSLPLADCMDFHDVRKECIKLPDENPHRPVSHVNIASKPLALHIEGFGKGTQTTSSVWNAVIANKSLVPGVDGVVRSDQMCHFCYGKVQSEAIKNGHTADFREMDGPWRGHRLRDSGGLVTCPVLFKMQCFACGATGAKAHTVSHCQYADHYRTTTEARRRSKRYKHY